jgi:lipoic acid synthetase
MESEGDPVSVLRLGTVTYPEACRLQEALAAARARGAIGDVLLLLQHPPVITLGRGGGREHVLASAAHLQHLGVQVLPTDRGGKATYHGPGQLVIYPILHLDGADLYDYLWRLEEVTIRVLGAFGIPAGRLEAHPGVWVAGDKIAAIGLALEGGITRHGLALNVAPDMAHFDLLVPCGIADHGVTSMERELGDAPPLEQVADRFVQAFAQVFARPLQERDPAAFVPLLDNAPEHPAWLWRRASAEAPGAVRGLERLLDDLSLHTVCQEALCPNLAECFAQGTATFMILGDTCTRGCRFCAVGHGLPAPLDPGEPGRVAEAAARLHLAHVVVTSVTRDDLPDGGAGHFATTIKALRRRLPGATLEMLIPDFGGSCAALETVLAARPDVLNHNLETVPRLYPRVRPGADYGRSLALLARAKASAPQIATKSGLMLGLGERVTEVLQVLDDLRRAGCELLTLGQYLQPTDRQLPVARYVSPAEFGGYEERARALGFRGVAAAPLVDSSYRALALHIATRAISRSRSGRAAPARYPTFH